MSKRDEIIGSIPANFKSEELLFNLKLIYAKLMVGGVPRENYITYSQLKLTFDRARQIAEDPKWGIPEEVKKIDEEIGNLEDNAESRYKVFMGYMRAALTAVAYNVQLATKDPWNDSEIAEALTNRTAGILPSRFKDLEPGETRSLKPKVSDTDYTKELLLEAERLWMERVCFDFGAGDMQKKLDNAARYQTQDDFYKAKDSNSWDDQNIKDNFLVLNGLLIYELSGPQKENFYRYLRAIFQGTSAGSLRESKVDVSTGEITQSTSQLTAAQETITFAELMIAIALERPNIIILKFKDVPTPGKRVKGGMHATIGNYTFIIFNEVILNNPQGIDLAPGSRVPHRMSFRDTLIHECVHVYPIYENEYRGRENIPGLDINLSPEDVVKSLRTSGSRSTTLGSTEFPTGKTTDEQRQWMQDAFKARIDALLENPGSNLENIWGMRDLAAFDAEGVFSGAVQTAFAARLAAELTLEFYGDRPDVNPIEQYDPDVKTFLFLQTLATPEYDPQGDFEKGVKSLIETEVQGLSEKIAYYPKIGYSLCHAYWWAIGGKTPIESAWWFEKWSKEWQMLKDFSEALNGVCLSEFRRVSTEAINKAINDTEKTKLAAWWGIWRAAAQECDPSLVVTVDTKLVEYVKSHTFTESTSADEDEFETKAGWNIFLQKVYGKTLDQMRTE